MLICELTVQRQHWVKLLMLLPKSGQWHQTVLIVIVFLSTIYSKSKKIKNLRVSFKNVFNEAVKITAFIKNPWVNLFNAITKQEVCIKHCASCLMEKHSCDCLWPKRTAFRLGYHFYYHKLWPFRLGYLAYTFSWKWSEPVTSRKSTESICCSDKILAFKQKLEFWGNRSATLSSTVF